MNSVKCTKEKDFGKLIHTSIVPGIFTAHEGNILAANAGNIFCSGVRSITDLALTEFSMAIFNEPFTLAVYALLGI